MGMSLNIDDGISIIMPTFRRPEGLRIALMSLLAQNACDLPVEIIVADNDPDGSAKDYVTQIAETSNQTIIYLHVPSPGVSNARNGALDIAKGRYIAWLDDDQDAQPNWINVMLETCKKHKAGIVFCPTYARIPNPNKYEKYYYEFFSRFGTDLQDGVIEEFFGAGNSFMDLQKCEMPKPAFDSRANETGGEDDLLFGYIQDHGSLFAWTSATIVHEDIRPHRATPEYIQQRSFAFGQAPSEIAYERRDILGVTKWMLIGLVQVLLYYPLAAITRVFGRPSFIHYLSKTCQGAGKIFWWGMFKPKLYGKAVVANKAF